MALPPLTAEQRAEALKKAAAARKHRAEIKADLKTRKRTLSQILAAASQDEALSKMKVVSLLEALPRVGTKTAAAVMEEIGISPARRIRGLGPNQTEELIKRFG
ncbi:integration host factor, actinobacterial type [Mobiluncus mulieris]|uniref:Integration host factor MihF n=1 Tax=Mobiluncus mulieris TaxID=2052 RepID=A0A7Y0UU11_9ACTO|nr:integration host factor, actinobacterial type [Mobiluncus mulieris]NMX03710.1 integration host factor MihF [Mobiluncus mulieris]NMX11075.1 integration host factor MihF [Mobiluncus mulieris]